MADFVGLDVSGLAELSKKLTALPPAVGNYAVDEVSKYMLDALRHYPPRKHVSMKEAYGGFKSDRQRRWFFAALHRGEIGVPYKRTQTLARGWKKVGGGMKAIVVNETPYAAWVQPEQNSGQANMMRLIGWKSMDTEIRERDQQIKIKLDAAVKKALRKVGLQG